MVHACTGDGEYNAVEESDLKKMPSVKRCVLEAIRLHAPGMITRKVTETHIINVSYHITSLLVEQFYFVRLPWFIDYKKKH